MKVSILKFATDRKSQINVQNRHLPTSWHKPIRRIQTESWCGHCLVASAYSNWLEVVQTKIILGTTNASFTDIIAMGISFEPKLGHG